MRPQKALRRHMASASPRLNPDAPGELSSGSRCCRPVPRGGEPRVAGPKTKQGMTLGSCPDLCGRLDERGWLRFVWRREGLTHAPGLITAGWPSRFVCRRVAVELRPT